MILIVAIAFVAVAMVVLAEGSKTMIWQTDSLYLTAAQENLTQSGLAWARHHITEPNVATKPVKLDPNDLDLQRAELKVEFSTELREAVVTVLAARRNRTVSDSVLLNGE